MLRSRLFGKRYGVLTVIGFAGISSRQESLWKCRCACGTFRIVPAGKLNEGSIRSCHACKIESNVVHGETRRQRGQSVEYQIWSAMKQRCYNRKHAGWKNYGARGIKVCARWKRSFTAFLEDIGRRPSPRHSIDRVNNDGNYRPGNCRWATARMQLLNSRRARKQQSFSF
jgi:hypothetical protein